MDQETITIEYQKSQIAHTDQFINRESRCKAAFQSYQTHNKLYPVNIVGKHMIIIENTNQSHVQMDNILNLKYTATVPQIQDGQYDVIITNPYIIDEIADQVDYTIIDNDKPQLPIAQHKFLIEEDSLNQKDRIKSILNYITSTIAEEQDIIVYCTDVDEMEEMRLVLASVHSTRVLIQINQQFNEISSQVFQSQLNVEHTIYLLLDSQEIYNEISEINDQITLIIHTNQRIMIQSHSKYAVNYEYCALSQTELLIRELPKSSRLGVKIVYAFTEQEYLELPIKPLKINIIPPKMIEILHDLKAKGHSHQLMQQFAIIISVLMTSGQLLAKQENYTDSFRNKNLIVRTSPFWSKVGDAISWVNIITHLANKISKIVSGEIEDPDILRRYQVELAKWCNDHAINLTKAILAIGHLKDFTNATEFQNLSLLNDMSAPPLLIKQQSSLTERIDERQIEQHLPDYFPTGQLYLGLPKQYLVNDQLCQIDEQNILKLIGYYQDEICILGFSYGKLFYSNSASISKVRKGSVVLKEIIINRIGSAIMNQLWANSGKQIQSLEEEYNCILIPNLDLNQIKIEFHEATLPEIEPALKQIIDNIKTNFENERKEIEFIQDTKFILTAGGIITDWINGQSQPKVRILGFPSEITKQEIMEVFDGIVDVVKIDIVTQSKGNVITEVTVGDDEDVSIIFEEFNHTRYDGNILQIFTINHNQIFSEERVFSKYLLKVFWYVKCGRGNAQILFKSQEFKQEAITILKDARVDGKLINIVDDGNLTLNITQMSSLTTEYNLLQLCGGKSKVESVILDCKPLFESTLDYSQRILNQISATIPPIKQNHTLNTIELISIKKKQHFKRVMMLSVQSQQQLQESLTNVNGMEVQLFGYTVKLHCHGYFRQQFIMNTTLLPAIEECITQSKREFQDNVKFEKSIIQIENQLTRMMENKLQLNISVKTYLLFNTIAKSIQKVQDGYPLDCKQQWDILVSEVGRLKLSSVEQLYSVHFLTDLNRKTIRVQCCANQVEQIEKVISEFLNSNISHNVSIPNSKLKQIIGLDGLGIKQIQDQFKLANVKYNPSTRQLHIEGNPKSVDEAIQQLIAITTDSDNNQIIQNPDTNIQSTLQMCNYCFDEMKHGYLLQNCGHKFCLECISYHILNSLNNIETLPIQCPQCNKLVFIDDLLIILGNQNHEKLIKMSINKFVFTNSTTACFCFTPGCQNVMNITNKKQFFCSVCRQNYCIECKTNAHPGITCWEYKTNDAKILQDLMKTEDIRKCPNCSTLAQKISGCQSVICASCKKSICWKNTDKGVPCMLIFSTSQECHKHLTDKHGGYY